MNVNFNPNHTISILMAQKTQYQSNKTQTNGQTNEKTDICTISLISSDNAYTKQDAIMQQWNKKGSFNLSDAIANKAKICLQNPNPSAEELEALEKELQQNGISKGVDWSNLNFDLRGIGFSKQESMQSIGEKFERKIEYIVSRYAAVANKIQNGNEEQKQYQMEKLNTIYEKSLEEIAHGYADITGEFLEKNGIKGETQKIYESIKNSANQKAAQYQKYLSDNGDFLGLSGTADAWLLDDDEYIAARLREQNIIEKESDGQYTLKDLAALGEMISSASEMEQGMTYKKDEETIGLDFAMMQMKTDTLKKSGTTSKNMNQLLSKLYDEFTSRFLDKMEKELQKKRETDIVYDAKTGFQKLNHNAIWNVYNNTMQHYKQYGDAMKAILKGAEFAITQRNNHSPETQSSYRYRNSNPYWNNFFEKHHSNGYDKPTTGYQDYLKQWNKFQSSIQK